MCACGGKKSGWTLSTLPWRDSDMSALVAAAGAAGGMPVNGYLLAEGVPTGDKRMIQAGALSWNTPMPLRRVREDFGAHQGAITVGAITAVTREDDGRLRWAGVLFNTPDGQAAYAEMKTRYSEAGLRYGISVDLDDTDVEVDDEDMMTVSSGRIRGATLCDIPAFWDAYGVLDESEIESEDGEAQEIESEDGEAQEIEEEVDGPAPALVAAAVRQVPSHWFRDPGLDGPTPLTVDEHGRLWGHMALWDTCHTGFPGLCVTPPKSRTNYSYFCTGLVRTSDGKEVPVGHLTMDTGHAGTRLSAAGTVAHYDNTGTIVADISVGEDKFGIWVAGSVRVGLDHRADEIQAAAVSGDWREIKGSLELVALLSVVSPGFPIPRARALAASGMMKTLIATSFNTQEAPVDEITEETVVEETPVEIANEQPAPVPADVVAELADGTVDQGDLADGAEPTEDVTIAIPEGDGPIEVIEDEPVVEDEPAEEPEAVVEEPVADDGAEPGLPAVEHEQDLSELLKQLDSLAGVPDVVVVDIEMLDRLAGV